MWNALQDQKKILDDQQLILLLEKSVHPSVADMIKNWN
jgi:hypothetical protein